MINFKYFALSLDDLTRQTLTSLFILDDKLSKYNKILMDNKPYKYYLNHCTILHKSQLKENNEVHQLLPYSLSEMLGQSFKIEIYEIGYSDKALAFKVSPYNIVCLNKIPYITIATFNGGKPVDSNYITNWEPLDEPIEIIGMLKIK